MQVYVYVSVFVVMRQNLIKYGLLKAYIFHRHGLLHVFCSTNSGNKTNDTIHTYVFHQDSKCPKKLNDYKDITINYHQWKTTPWSIQTRSHQV